MRWVACVRQWLKNLWKSPTQKTSAVSSNKDGFDAHSIEKEKEEKHIVKQALSNPLELVDETKDYKRFGEATEEQMRLFSNVQGGDVVVAKMPKTDQEFQESNIKEGHRIRPYILVQKTEHGFFGVPGTTNPKFKNSPETFYYRTKNADKGSYFLAFNYTWIPTSHLKTKVETLSVYSKEDFQKILFNSNRRNGKTELLEDIRLKTAVGEIVQDFDGSLWYVYSMWNTDCYLYRVYSKEHANTIKIHCWSNTIQYIDSKNRKEIQMQEIQQWKPMWYCPQKTIDIVNCERKKS